ncbi:hypothetical protein RF11_09108 [Thelohanellus kitauei]|uniref:Uncharacterized protein n=1 Tax=Thelohanellus kitauei TaxID=669202 RepID=A0A0C2NH95_THEKT|nr:hypothetical protein RF11_09108 [Thelohanellus kitauei]
MVLLYVFFSIGYILKARAEEVIPPVAEPLPPKFVMEESYPYEDGDGGHYQAMEKAGQGDTRFAHQALKGAGLYPELLSCPATRVAYGMQGTDHIKIVELECDNKFYYVKAMRMPVPKTPTKAAGKYMNLFKEAPVLTKSKPTH